MSWSAGTFRHATRISRFESSFMFWTLTIFRYFQIYFIFQKEYVFSSQCPLCNRLGS